MRRSEIFDMTDRTVLVTGGATGLGYAIAETMAANGARVMLLGHHEETTRPAVEALAAKYRNVEARVADVCDPAEVESVFDAAERLFGPVTVLFNNAGTAHADKALKLTPESWRKVMTVNLDAAFFVAQQAAHRMIAARTGGSIVNIGSILAERPQRNVAAYAASKAALSQMTRSMALEWAGAGIRVNEIVPGWFPTAMTDAFTRGPAGEVLRQKTPLKRFGEPADLAGAALLLSSRAGAYITGASIVVDGGHSLA